MQYLFNSTWGWFWNIMFLHFFFKMSKICFLLKWKKNPKLVFETVKTELKKMCLITHVKGILNNKYKGHIKDSVSVSVSFIYLSCLSLSTPPPLPNSPISGLVERLFISCGLGYTTLDCWNWATFIYYIFFVCVFFLFFFFYPLCVFYVFDNWLLIDSFEIIIWP